MNPTTQLIARQTSALEGFHYRVEEHSRAVGELIWPMLAQARNARVPPTPPTGTATGCADS